MLLRGFRGEGQQTYTYDGAFGNLKEIDPAVCATPGMSHTINSSNQIADPGYSYDLAGNLLTDGNSNTYQYDAEDRLVNFDNGVETYTYDAEGNRAYKQGDTNTQYFWFNGQVIAEEQANGDWSDYIYGNGKRIAKADSYEDGIHLQGTNCSDCGWQFTWFYFTNIGNLANYVIKPGDTLFWRQAQWGAQGGVVLVFGDGTNTAWTTYDQDGQLTNSDTTVADWHYRRFDLSGLAGETINSMAIGADGNTPAGSWDMVFADIVVVSADGSVYPIYNGQSGFSLNTTGTSGVTNRAYSDRHISNIVGYPLTTTMYYHGDHLGSEGLMTDYYGYPVFSATYLPFGMELNPQITVNNYKFTGQERDSESTLDHFPARYYSSQMGRFMTPDPLGIFSADLSDPQTLNQYSYVRNNPVSLFDPTGLAPQCTLVTSWASSMIYQGSPDHGPGEPINIVGAPSTTLVCADTGNDSPITLGGGGYRPPSIGSRLTNTRISDTPINLLLPLQAPTSKQNYQQCMSNFHNSTVGKIVQFGSLLSFSDNAWSAVKEWTAAFAIKGGYLKIAETAGQSLQPAGEVSPVTTVVKPLVGEAATLGVATATTVDAAARVGFSQQNPNNLLNLSSPILPVFP